MARSEVAEEMSARDPLDAEQVKFIDGGIVPREVHDTIAEAAEKRGIDMSRYLINVAYRQSLYDLTGSDND
ncbi:MAG TPA: hypothetical protein VFI84_02015 [Candidatus Saccharimonadales bacterium]|nr:hypothetical protein [Candidatus Saccharimonadales bacterium]